MPRKIGLLMSVVFLLSVFLPPLALPQQQGQTGQEKATTQESRRSSEAATQSQPLQAEQAPGAPASEPSTLLGVMVSTEFILGSNLQDTHGEDMGEITQLLINPDTGSVSYAVVAVGGFMGMGEKNIVIPWRAIKMLRDKNKLLLQASKTVLEEAPEYTKEGAAAEQSQ